MATNRLTRVLGPLALVSFASVGFGLGCSSSDGFGNLLAGQACDAFTISSDPRCVCCSKSNSGQCTSGVSPCAPDGASPTCGDPCPSGLSCVELNGSHVCGTESKCVGPVEQSCGSCGAQTRTCNDGSWSDWSACQGEGACAPGAVQSCGTGKTETCSATCQWGACVSECTPGQADSAACGNCGTQTRACTTNGAWGAWGACQGAGACQPGSVQSCGNGTETCSSSCLWGACLECQPQQTDTQACGQCQTQTRSCGVGGTWGAFSACTNTGSCTPGAVQACSGGSQTCADSCEWVSCIPYVCQPGTPVTASCGYCGTQTTPCLDNGTLGTPSTCDTQGVCQPDSTESCGTNGIHVCTSGCQWGACLPVECTSGTAENQVCGLCGTQTRSCVNGRWTAFGACGSAGVCTPNAKSSCGNGGTQTCAKSCQWGQCTGQTCDGSFVQSCGICGIQTRTCQNGVWSAYSACTGARDCIPGSSRGCNGDSGTQSCNFQCFWDACQ